MGKEWEGKGMGRNGKGLEEIGRNGKVWEGIGKEKGKQKGKAKGNGNGNGKVNGNRKARGEGKDVKVQGMGGKGSAG